MESSDNKTSSRPVPGRPSLLNSQARASSDEGPPTRMLASVERDGRMAGSTPAGSPRSRRRYGYAAGLLVLLAGAGVFFAWQPSGEASADVASASPAHAIAGAPGARSASMAGAGAGADTGAVTSTPTSAAGAADPAGPAASARIELDAAAPPVAAAQALVASGPSANPLDKLALNDKELTPVLPNAVAPAAAASAPSAGGPVREAAFASSRPPDAGAARPPAAHAAPKVAARKARRPDEDADTELVAAIIARLDRRGAVPAAPAVAPRDAESTAAHLATQVRQCSSNPDLLAARQCRNKACENHWGKAEACPAARAPKTSDSEGGDDGKRG